MADTRKNLYIIGGGGFGREMELWLSLTGEDHRDFNLAGYIDDNIHALDGFSSAYKVVGTIEQFNFDKNDYAIISIADPQIKENVYKRLKNKINFYTFIANTAIIADRQRIGEGSVICPYSIISPNAEVGKFVTVNCGTKLGHDSITGDFTSMMVDVVVGGGTIIGKKVYFGSQSVIVPRINICDNVKIGTGSIVVNEINKSGVYFGNPAKFLMP